MKQEAQEKLKEIYNRDGALHPPTLVEEAEAKDSPLHDYFEWDDGEAAHQHRLNQARQLIRLAVTIIPAVSNGPVRTYVSLSSLRRTDTGSYLATVDILSDAEKRAQALADAIRQLVKLQSRYAHLPELSPVWASVALAATALEAKAA